MAAYWAGREETFQEILHRANRAALEYLQAWAGVTRTGYHGARVGEHEPGRFEEAGLIVTSWLQGTSRDGDPQDHIHNQIARITKTMSDGKWRAHDTASLRAVLGALQAIAATTVECELTAEFGVEWIPRADGRGNEIKGVTQAQMDAYSTRTVQVHEKERELARAWARRHGRAPTSRELLHIANDATLQSRNGKGATPVDWDALAARWDATLGGELARIAPDVSNARGPGARGLAREPGVPPSRETQARALAKALILVSDKQPAWTRHDLLEQLALVMPSQTRWMSVQAAREMLLGLADEALTGRAGDVVCVEAPEWPPLPQSLRRELDGRSIYTRPGAARYVTTAQLSLEERLVAQARAQGAPRLPSELAARRLGADAALLQAQLRGRAHDTRERAAPRGLRLDQAAAVWHALTSARTVEVITGPAGTGKTRVLAAIARAWDGPVIGTATSQNAANELRRAGVQVAANTSQLLTDIHYGRIRPGSLIVADDAEVAVARKAGDHDRTGRHDTLAASYRALRDCYRQREQTLAQTMTDRHEWEHATADSRHLAIAADAELRRRHPGQKIEPLHSAEPAPVGDAEDEQAHPAPDGQRTETATWIRDLAAQRAAFREKMGQRRRLMEAEELDWADLGGALSSWWTPRRDAILQPPKSQIPPSAMILQHVAEHDIEPEAAD